MFEMFEMTGESLSVFLLFAAQKFKQKISKCCESRPAATEV